MRLEYLNKEERRLSFDTSLAYMGIFYLPGYVLSSTNPTRHSIKLESGVEPINSKPYRLLVAAKKMNASGKQKFRLVVDYRKLKEKITSDAYP